MSRFPGFPPKKNKTKSSLTPPRPVGLSDPQYAARRKSMFEFLNRMHALGVDVDLDIPAIAAIGWQSAGKSSLIEAISGITLPRASGTCTRCPTECQLACSDDPWTCTVWLQLNTAADGSALTNPRKILFGHPITEKSEVTERVRRAQRAILSPSTPPDAFLSGPDADTVLYFSANRIVLHIAGPDVADLSFIDLPGLFVGGDEESDMQLVKNLAISYLEKPSCIILLTVACETDFVNQGAHKLAQEHDPHGDRTVGVLTKPDRIPATEEELWLPYIRGEREGTTWFCVKCPDSEAIKSGITWEDARQEESNWFSSKTPWSTLEDEFKQKLGTIHLTRRLGDMLYDLITERLPHIEQELNEHLEKVNRDLKDLPSPPSSALSEVLRLITEFTRGVERQGVGIPGRDGLLHQIKLPKDCFRVAIRRTVPCFVPHLRDGPVSKGIYEERPVFVSVRSAGSSDTAASDPEPPPPPPPPHTYPPFLVGEEDSNEIGFNDGEEIFIDDVLETAECAVTRELPNNYPFIVQKEYILAFVGQWKEPSQTVFSTIVEKVKEATLRIVDIHFGNYAHTRFKQRVSTVVITHLDQCSQEALKRIEFYLNVEREPSTRNTDYFKDYRKKFLNFYSGLFHEDSNDYFIKRVQRIDYQSQEFSKALDIIMKNLPRIGFHNVNRVDLMALQASEEEDDALKIMADVRAYFQVAFKRFVDNIIKAIDEEVVLGLSNALQDALMSGLKLDSPDAHETCAKLIAEQPHIAEKRKSLLAHQKKLLLAKEELNELYNALT